jgi:tetratricopeptide (TPR) repeat protein
MGPASTPRTARPARRAPARGRPASIPEAGHPAPPAWLIPALALGAAGLAWFRSADPDFWFHLAAGRSILAHGLPAREAWCLAARGGPPWVPEWLFEVSLHLARAVGGDLAIAAWRALCAGGAVLLALGLVRSAGGWSWAALLLAPLVLAVGRLRMVARGEQWFALGAIAFLAAFEAARRGRADRTRWLPILQLVWANSHSSWVFGPLIAALYAAAEAIAARRERARRPRARRFAFVALALLAASALTPQPLLTLAHPLRFALTARGDPMTSSIEELQPWSWSGFTGDPYTGVLLLAVAALAAGGRRALRGSPPLALAALAALLLGMRMLRFQPVAALVAWPALALALEPAGRAWARALPLAVGVAAAAAGVAWTVRDAPRTRPGVAPEWGSFPVRAVALADSFGLEGPVLNTFEYGGYILWARGDAHPPLIDGRALGSAEFRSRFARAPGDPLAQDSLLAMWPFTHALLRPPREVDDRLAARLARRPDWALVFTDDAACLLVRRDAYEAIGRSRGYALLSPDNMEMGRLIVRASGDSMLAARLGAELERARAESPWHARASYWLSMLRYALGRPRETLALLDEAERIRPTLPGVALARGLAWAAAGDQAEARRWLQRARRVPGSAPAAERALRSLR